MKKIFIYILFVFGVLQVACETDAEIEIPSQEPKYVVTAFIKPNDDIQTLTLYQSDPIFDGIDTNNFSTIKNAVIKINNGAKTTILKYDNTLDLYSLHKDSMLIEFDKDYSLTVEHNGKTIKTDFRTLSATPIVITEFKIDSIVEDDPFGGSIKTYYAYTKWQDPPNEKNYYCLELFGLEIRPNGDTVRFPLSDFYGNVYISDEGRNGTIMNTTLEAYGYFDGIFGGNNNYVGYEIVLSKVDEHYYKYFKSLQNYYGDDPFSEPSLIYSNINNGLGLIGSFNPFYYKKLL